LLIESFVIFVSLQERHFSEVGNMPEMLRSVSLFTVLNFTWIHFESECQLQTLALIY